MLGIKGKKEKEKGILIVGIILIYKKIRHFYVQSDTGRIFQFLKATPSTAFAERAVQG